MENEALALIQTTKADTPECRCVIGLGVSAATPGARAQFTSGDALQGERRLLLAVLHDALYCYQKYIFAKKSRHRQIFREVRRWFTSPETDAPFTFEYVCHILGIDPGYLRRGLRKWRVHQMAAPAAPKRQRLPPHQASIGPRERNCLSGLRGPMIRPGIGDEIDDERLVDSEAAGARENAE